MVEEDYPFIETMCRLCLKENSANVNIFTTANPKEGMLSIPIRIMSCVALEVQENDNLPKCICTECRYQLEKYFYFRKRSQYADTKLRKHLRLLSLGKKSKVFAKKSENEDDDDDEAEFEDSLNFINQQDQIRDEKNKLEQHQELVKLRPVLIDEIRREFNTELEETILPQMRKECEAEVRKKLRSEIQQEIKEELRGVMEEELRENLLPTLREQCREQELTGILNEMENFLREKRVQQENEHLKRERGKILISLSELREDPPIKSKPDLKRRASRSHENLAKQLRPQIKPNALRADQTTTVGKATTLHIESSNLESCSGGEENENDNDCNNYYIIDDHMDDNDEETNDANDDEHDDGHDHGNDEDGEEGAAQDEEQDALVSMKPRIYQMETKSKRSVTSYQIDGSGEDIQLFKRKDSLKSDEGKDDGNIVILNFERSSVEEEHLEMVEFVKFNDKVIRLKNDINAAKPNDTQKRRSSSTEIKEMKTEIGENSGTPVVTQRITDTPKTFKCPSCPLQFSTENSYNRHIRTHVKAGEKGVSFHCPDCGIFVSCKSALTRHMIIHSGVKPHACEECGKSFVQREILKRHMQTHTGAKPYKCKHCGRAFAQKANLIQHVNKNHLEVPIVGQHPCPLCPKRFNHSSGLSRHLATHSGVTFQCTECERTFSDRSSVKRHIVNMHGSSLENESLKD